MRSIIMQEMMHLKDISILDVREIDEVMTGKIPGAQNMPLSSFQVLIPTLSRDKTYHVVCQSGSRSLMACQILTQMGYNVVNVLGGMGAYKGVLDYEV